MCPLQTVTVHSTGTGSCSQFKKNRCACMISITSANFCCT